MQRGHWKCYASAAVLGMTFAAWTYLRWNMLHVGPSVMGGSLLMAVWFGGGACLTCIFFRKYGGRPSPLPPDASQAFLVRISSRSPSGALVGATVATVVAVVPYLSRTGNVELVVHRSLLGIVLMTPGFIWWHRRTDAFMNKVLLRLFGQLARWFLVRSGAARNSQGSGRGRPGASGDQ